MQYIDSGSRNPEHTLGAWLRDLATQKIRDLRWQAGYFNVAGLAPMASLIHGLSQNKSSVRCVVGSNQGETTRQDVETLVRLVGCPKGDAQIAIVRYHSGLFHPKVYHAIRHDGSQTAYVGSSNLTGASVTGLNIEAGLILDSAKDDPVQLLDEVARAIDAWFEGAKPGVHLIQNPGDIQPLVDAEVLRAAAPPPPPAQRRAPADSDDPSRRARLKPLLTFPPVIGHPEGAATSTGDTAPEPGAGERPPPVPRDQFPPYILFAQTARGPTHGEAALTNSALPGDAAGLIVRLNRDSTRHFEGRSGTANISLPVATMATIQFGVYQGRYLRPRAVFPIRMRYVSRTATHIAPIGNTSIMVYGHAPGETGHGDIRMVMPSGACREIRQFAEENGLHVPRAEDPIALEWPTVADPTFKVTFVDAELSLFTELRILLVNDQPVGRGARWLPADLIPDW